MVTYCEPIFDGKNIVSCDMLRINFKLNGDVALRNLFDYIDKFQYDLSVKYYQSFKSYAYRHLFVFSVGEYAFKLSVGLNSDDKYGYLKGFIEFNPNKILGFMYFEDGFIRCYNNPFTEIEDKQYISKYEIYDMFKMVHEKLLSLITFSEIKRFDIAIDVPIFREKVQLFKDNRKYMQIYKSSSNYTEYLGTSVSGGRVKIYNKTIESMLDYDLTRVEVTCDSLEYNIFNRYMPKVYIKDKELSEANNFVFQLLDELPAERKTFYIGKMSRRLKNHYNNMVADEILTVSPLVHEKIVEHMQRFLDLSFIAQL